MTRFHAAFYHLLISLAVFLVLAYIILYIWYPGFFYTIDGGWEGMRIIIGVDLILGPLLTLIVFKAGKPGLRFDLAAIGTLQVLCLTAGMYIVYIERPQFFVFYDKHFYSNSADTYSDYGQPVPELKKFSQTTPGFVIAKPPEDPIEEADLRVELYDEKVPMWTYEPSYSPLTEHMDEVMAGAYSLAELRKRDTNGQLNLWLSEHGGTAENYAFFPVHSRYGSPFVVVRVSDREFIGILDVPAPLNNVE